MTTLPMITRQAGKIALTSGGLLLAWFSLYCAIATGTGPLWYIPSQFLLAVIVLSSLVWGIPKVPRAIRWLLPKFLALFALVNKGCHWLAPRTIWLLKQVVNAYLSILLLFISIVVSKQFWINLGPVISNALNVNRDND